jgi:CubicO group peptidase (beta-lactamase class C family)
MAGVSDSRANAHVKRAIDTAIKERGEMGLQVCAYYRGALVIDTWAGVADPATGRLVDGDTLFNVFSVTKGIALTAMHILAERGAFNYDTLVGELWPEYATNGKEKTTVRHILTHRAGIPQMPEGITPELMCDWPYMIRFIESQKPMFEPGTQNAYHQLTYGWLLSELVHRADPKHRMIDQFVYEEIGKPLKAPDLWIGLPDSQLPRVAKLWMGEDFDWPAGSLFRISLPASVNLIPSIYGRPDVRRAAEFSRHAVKRACGPCSPTVVNWMASVCCRSSAWPVFQYRESILSSLIRYSWAVLFLWATADFGSAAPIFR